MKSKKNIKKSTKNRKLTKKNLKKHTKKHIGGFKNPFKNFFRKTNELNQLPGPYTPGKFSLKNNTKVYSPLTIQKNQLNHTYASLNPETKNKVNFSSYQEVPSSYEEVLPSSYEKVLPSSYEEVNSMTTNPLYQQQKNNLKKPMKKNPLYQREHNLYRYNNSQNLNNIDTLFYFKKSIKKFLGIKKYFLTNIEYINDKKFIEQFYYYIDELSKLNKTKYNNKKVIEIIINYFDIDKIELLNNLIYYEIKLSIEIINGTLNINNNTELLLNIEKILYKYINTDDFKKIFINILNVNNNSMIPNSYGNNNYNKEAGEAEEGLYESP